MSKVRLLAAAESEEYGKQVGVINDTVAIHIPEGCVFHAKSKQRTLVPFDPPLRAETLKAIRRLHELLASARVPAPVLTPRCDGCSLREICLPELTRARRFDLFACT